MKFKVRATVIWEWEEDSENWPDVPETKEDMLKAINGYNDLVSYIIDGDTIVSTKVESID